MYASNDKVAWDNLHERFKMDESRTLNLHKEIATLSQAPSLCLCTPLTQGIMGRICSPSPIIGLFL